MGRNIRLLISQENTIGQLMAIPTQDFADVLNSERDTERTVGGSKVTTWKVTEVSLSYEQCFLYLVFSSIKISILPSHGWILSGKSSYTWICI